VEATARRSPWSSRRIRSQGDFQKVFRRGVRLDGALFVLVAAPSEAPGGRLGMSASRRVGSAVKRNRARRLLREAYRRHASDAVAGYDLVAIVKPALAGCALAQVQSEFDRRVERLAKVGRLAGRAAAARRD